MDNIQTNNDEAERFLELFCPGGPWILTSISTDKSQITTATFRDIDKVHEFLKVHNGHRNIYFHVNPCITDLDKKANRENVAALAWLHVDIDPRPGEDIHQERRRALELLQSPPGQIPPPTCIIFSGGGYQGFWKLTNPMPIMGEADKYSLAARYNLQLELSFKADSCHNVDRIMRLPGTVNIPDAVKRKKGREPTLAKIVFFDTSITYDLIQFQPAHQIQGPIDFFSGSRPNEDSEEVVRLETISDLDEWKVPDRIKAICISGKNDVAEGPKKDNSRSSWLFDGLCGLHRAGVPEDVIFAIITDRDYGISASVLDKGRNSTKYAHRQITRAKEFVADPTLMEMNDEFAIIQEYGGKCVVVEEIKDNLGIRLASQSFSDFRNRYCNRFVTITSADGKTTNIELGKWWLNHPQRRQYRRVVFEPGVEIPDSLNLWKGFAVEPIPGDCSLYLNHIRDNIAQGDEVIYQYLLGWMARCVQKPNEQGHTAIVLRGEQGTGKGVFANEFGSLFGRHFVPVSDPTHLVGVFNGHLESCVVLFGDEAFFAGDKRHEAILKTLITEPTLSLRKMYSDMRPSPNYTHMILASNSRWVVPAGPNERRYCVLDVGDACRQDLVYFGKIAEQQKNGGRSALLYFLLNYDVSKFSVRTLPKTKALAEQKMLSLSPIEDWWLSKLMDGVVFDSQSEWVREVPKSSLYEDYVRLTRLSGMRVSTLNGFCMSLGNISRKTATTKKLHTYSTIDPNGDVVRHNSRVAHFILPQLSTAREEWEAKYGSTDWPP